MHTEHTYARHELRDLPLVPGAEPAPAAHLVSTRLLYTHHGIYVGGGRVIHYAGLAHGLGRGPVESVSLERFARGHAVQIRCDARRFDPREIVERAYSRLGERRYRVLTNNCEHFCAWALRDESCSVQIERILAIPRFIARLLRGICRGMPVTARQASSVAE